MQAGGSATDLRAIRIPDWQWDAVKAKARRRDTTVSEVVRGLLDAWLAYEDTGQGMEQLSMIAVHGPADKPGVWERLAAKRIRELGKAGYLTVETAGYADALRMAGRNLDMAERGGTVQARVAAAASWERALARIVPAPVDVQREGQDDPWKALADDLRAATVQHGADA